MLPATAEPLNGFPGYFVTPEGQVWSIKDHGGAQDMRTAQPGVVSQIATGRNWRHVFPRDWAPPARQRLASEQRAEIRSLAANGNRQTDIAKRFGVTQSAISHLLKRTARMKRTARSPSNGQELHSTG